MTRALLLPLTPLFRLALAARELLFRTGLKPVRRLDWPVVSVGNLSTGGSGKTPLTIALAQALAARGLRVDVLSRGYGRSSRLPARVDPHGSAVDFGDEPLLIAREARVPVFVAPQRYFAGRLAESQPAAAFGLHLLDDGFQHRALHRNLDILLLSRRDWQDRLLPAGNLREPLSALRRASVLAIPADEPDFEADLRAAGWQGPIWRLRRIMRVPPAPGPVFAFCGIARPGPFFGGLRASGLALIAERPFRDHFPYSEPALRSLLQEGLALGASAFVTTAKDSARLGRLTALFPPECPLLVTALRTEIENQDQALAWLLARLPSRLTSQRKRSTPRRH